MSTELLTVREAAQLFGLAEVTIRVWMSQSKLTFVRLGRSVRIPLSEITRIVELGTRPAKN